MRVPARLSDAEVAHTLSILEEYAMTQDISSFATEEDVTIALLAGSITCPGWNHYVTDDDDSTEKHCTLCNNTSFFPIEGYQSGFIKSMLALTNFRRAALAEGRPIW